ncbi:MAG: hypothetical protein R8J94_05140 [Acidimicrobiia bacterium]|nr:hypothetical protein [Acidimicrobiia bacterium]
MIDALGGVRVQVGDQPSELHRRDAFLAALVSLLNRRALDADDNRLHLHAAALVRGTSGVVFAATGGTGKSTLAAALGQRGWTYMSDEMVAIGYAGEIRAFPKPITLRSAGATLLGDLASRAIQFPGTSSRRSFLPASRIPTDFCGHAHAYMLVFLRKAEPQPSTACSWSPLTAASATVMAIENSFDFDRYGESSLSAIGDFCLNAMSIELYLAELKSTTETIEELVDQLPTRPSFDRCIEGPSIGDVKSILLNGEAVLHNTANNRVVSLPPESSKEWQRHADGTREGSSLLFDELRRIEILTGAT